MGKMPEAQNFLIPPRILGVDSVANDSDPLGLLHLIVVVVVLLPVLLASA